VTAAANPLDRAELERATGAGVRVLVMDSGIEGDHPTLTGRDIPNYEAIPMAVGTDVTWRVEEAPAGDAFGHGTAVASILASHAPGVRLTSLRMLDADRQGSSERVLAGLRWAIEKQFDVVNCSFGTFGPATSRFLASYKRVVDVAFCNRVLLIGACSNSDHRLTSLPASFPTVISTDCGRLAPTPLPGLRRRQGQLVEFVARGVDVSVSWKDGSARLVTGSSFAAPHLAALVARIRELRPEWNACEVKTQLYRLAEPALAEDDD
jgi:subtilisin